MSPFFARLTESASTPRPIRSVVLNAARASALVSRRPSLSAAPMRRSAGSVTRSSGMTGGAMPLLGESFDGESDVMSAESRRVADRSRDFALHGGVGRAIQVTLRILRTQVDRRRNHAVDDRQGRGD